MSLPLCEHAPARRRRPPDGSPARGVHGVDGARRPPRVQGAGARGDGRLPQRRTPRPPFVAIRLSHDGFARRAGRTRRVPAGPARGGRRARHRPDALFVRAARRPDRLRGRHAESRILSAGVAGPRRRARRHAPRVAGPRRRAPARAQPADQRRRPHRRRDDGPRPGGLAQPPGSVAHRPRGRRDRGAGQGGADGPRPASAARRRA